MKAKAGRPIPRRTRKASGEALSTNPATMARIRKNSENSEHSETEQTMTLHQIEEKKARKAAEKAEKADALRRAAEAEAIKAEAEATEAARMAAEAEAKAEAVKAAEKAEAEAKALGGPGMPANSDALAAKAAEAKAAQEAAEKAAKALPDALLSIAQGEEAKREAFIAVWRYFDETLAWRTVDKLSSIDAAVAIYYHVPDGDKAALKQARDVNTYRRRMGAKFAGGNLYGTQPAKATTADGEATDKAAEKTEADKVGAYLKQRWGKLSHEEQGAILKALTAPWEAAEKVRAAVAEAEAREAEAKAKAEADKAKAEATEKAA